MYQHQTFDLPGLILGREIVGTTIRIDATAAGFGWFVVRTPLNDSEFRGPFEGGTRLAVGSSPAAGRMDLPTVVMRELGHALDFKDLDEEDNPGALMAESLAPGVLRFPAGPLLFSQLDRAPWIRQTCFHPCHGHFGRFPHGRARSEIAYRRADPSTYSGSGRRRSIRPDQCSGCHCRLAGRLALAARRWGVGPGAGAGPLRSGPAGHLGSLLGTEGIAR